MVRKLTFGSINVRALEDRVLESIQTNRDSFLWREKDYSEVQQFKDEKGLTIYTSDGIREIVESNKKYFKSERGWIMANLVNYAFSGILSHKKVSSLYCVHRHNDPDTNDYMESNPRFQELFGKIHEKPRREGRRLTKEQLGALNDMYVRDYRLREFGIPEEILINLMNVDGMVDSTNNPGFNLKIFLRELDKLPECRKYVIAIYQEFKSSPRPLMKQQK